MPAPLDTREAEKAAGVANDAQVSVQPEKENNEATGKKKGTNGFLVRLPGRLTAATSYIRVVADELG